MPLLEIATAQPNFQNHLGVLSHTKVFPCAFTFGNDLRLGKSFGKRRVEAGRARFVIKAVATLEPKILASEEDGHLFCADTNPSPSASEVESPGEDSTDLSDREKLRRMRISKANKGNTPWNKGRKHSPETLQRIRERTRLAMQNPKVKMKLVNLGHSQSEETKVKIAAGVRMGWRRRREKLIVQETCFFEWQNLIAEASRNGCTNEEELQWDSYNVQNKQLEQEWTESVEERKSTRRLKGNKRAPKSPEQRRKIAEAIAAKWADPTYRNRVCSGMAKFHGVPVGGERKTRRKRSSSTELKPDSPPKRKASKADPKPKINPIERMKLKRSKIPLFKDPLASSKLEMLKNIRSQRAAAETNGTEAIERARLLIGEAEKAAQALEVAAARSCVARASLMETRKLIAEAIQFVEQTGTEPELVSDSSPELAKSTLEAIAATPVINGGPVCADGKNSKFGIAPFFSEVSVKEMEKPHPNGTKTDVVSVGDGLGSKEAAVMKKWVRGKLVEVTESS